MSNNEILQLKIPILPVRQLFTILLSLLPLLSIAQTGEMRVYTVAGKTGATALGDGGPATAALLGNTEGIWMDGSSNLYIATLDNRIRKVNPAGIITTIAGTGESGYSGDGGAATLAKLKQPYGLYASEVGDVYFADMGNNRIRRIDAVTGVISTIAGNGNSGFSGDNGPATSAELHNPDNVYIDSVGNIFIGEQWKIRKVDAVTGVITTFAGTGVIGGGGYGDGGPATVAKINYGSTMLFDKSGNFYFADRGGSRIRKINTSGIISTVVGTSVGYSGDGGPATAAQVNNPISFAIDSLGNIVIGDNGNNVFRWVNMETGIIRTIAGDTGTHATSYEGALATSTQMHPEFIYLDSHGNIFYSNWGTHVRKITNYSATAFWIKSSVNEHKDNDAINLKIFPNPTINELHIENIKSGTGFKLYNIVGAEMQQGVLLHSINTISTQHLPPGLYLLALTYGEGMRTVHKIVKE